MPVVDEELRKAIGARLTRWREDRGGEQKKAFWPQYGLDHAKMGRYENAKETPSPEKIVEICRKTGMSADYLLLDQKAGNTPISKRTRSGKPLGLRKK